MLKRFMLFAGDRYYPVGGMFDFVDHSEDLNYLINLAEDNKGDYCMGWAYVFDTELMKSVWCIEKGFSNG